MNSVPPEGGRRPIEVLKDDGIGRAASPTAHSVLRYSRTAVRSSSVN